MMIYVARDLTGDLYAYNEEPLRDIGHGCFVCRENLWKEDGRLLELDKSLFPKVTWENSPQKAVLTLLYER